MSDGISFDFTELLKLSATLDDAGTKIIPFVRKAVEVTAFNVKKDWKPEATGSGVQKKYAASIDYEMKLNTSAVIGAEVGPNLGRAGGSFGLLEDGGGGVKSAPQHAGRKAAKKNEADFEKGLTQAGLDALK